MRRKSKWYVVATVEGEHIRWHVQRTVDNGTVETWDSYNDETEARETATAINLASVRREV